jgi:tetratricopeptide (TPR) repeat protein
LSEAGRTDSTLQSLIRQYQDSCEAYVKLSGTYPPDDPRCKAAEEKNEEFRTNVVKRTDEILAELQARTDAGKKAQLLAEPPAVIYTPTDDDSQKAFAEYTADAGRRLDHDQKFPNEPRQITPGESVTRRPDGTIQVVGQVAVMNINGRIARIVFDRNPDRDFYIEESFPLDWMFPHLEPHGLIMKLNRQPLAEISEAVVRKDHDYWQGLVNEMLGDWLTNGTSVKAVTEFVERVYLRKDLSDFKGDPGFVRDDFGPKMFSKWRSSIGGLYAWRVGGAPGMPTPAGYLAKSAAERERMLKEADFAFRQAFALCPYSPEAVFRYVNLLASSGRMEDALLIAETCRKLDPGNGAVASLAQQLSSAMRRPDPTGQARSDIARLEDEVRSNTNDFKKIFDLASKYVVAQQNDRAIQLLDGVLNNPQAPADAVAAVVQAYGQLNDTNKLQFAVGQLEKRQPDTSRLWTVIAGAYAQLRDLSKLESALEKLTTLAPDEPEVWYNLSVTRASRNKPADAIAALRRSLELNAQRLEKNSSAKDVRVEVDKDRRFDSIRGTPEFKTLSADFQIGSASPAPGRTQELPVRR